MSTHIQDGSLQNKWVQTGWSRLKSILVILNQLVFNILNKRNQPTAKT